VVEQTYILLHQGLRLTDSTTETFFLKKNYCQTSENIQIVLFFNRTGHDSAPSRRANRTVELLQNETPNFINPALWPPNSPDLNPVDYRIWIKRAYKTKISNIKELKHRIKQVWDEMDQREIDKAISEWRPRLQTCIRAYGGHFEHKIVNVNFISAGL